MNFLEMLSLKSRRTAAPNLRLVINSFTGNEKESEHSEEVKMVLKSKNYRITEIIDVNQELIFEKEKKITRNIRENFHKKKQIFKINSKFSLPQIIVGDELALSYDEFIILNESGVLEKIMTGTTCNHIRIYNNEIVYSRTTQAQDEFSYCVYCYSKKKIRQTITFISNIRDYKDYENHEILSFCEGNNMTIRLVDFENYFEESSPCYTKINLQIHTNYFFSNKIKELVQKREKVFLIDQEVFGISEFFEIFEKRIFSNLINLECLKCSKKLNSFIDTNQCIGCLSQNSESPESKRNPRAANALKKAPSLFQNRKRTNPDPYHFVQKLKLMQHLRNANIINPELINTKKIPNDFKDLNLSFYKKQHESLESK